MKYSKSLFKAGDGLNLFQQQWLPDDEQKAVVIIVHGFAEHSGRYSHVAEYLTNHGYAVYTFDLRGHGCSEGPRACVDSFDEYLADLKLFQESIAAQNPGKALFILGHSLGGTIVTLFTITQRPDISGLILSGPLLKLRDDTPLLLVYFTLAISPIFPRLPVVKRVNKSSVSRDPEVVERYQNDPLVYRGKIRAREAAEIKRVVDIIQDRMEEVSAPFFIAHGTADHLSDIAGSRQFNLRARSTDKTLKEYEGFYHEVLNEPDKETVFADIVAWLNARIKP